MQIRRSKIFKYIRTGIWTKEPLFTVGYEKRGTTGTEPFLIKIGPWIGVTVGIFPP